MYREESGDISQHASTRRLSRAVVAGAGGQQGTTQTKPPLSGAQLPRKTHKNKSTPKSSEVMNALKTNKEEPEHY